MPDWLLIYVLLLGAVGCAVYAWGLWRSTKR